MSTPTLRDVIAVLDSAYPPGLAEDWDSVGLISGDLQQPVRRVFLAVDPTEATVAEAVEAQADLLLTHHPLALRGLHTIAATTTKGRILRAAVRNDVALFNAHTNADRARDGVNDALAAAVGLRDCVPLVPADELRLEKVVTFVPAADADRVIDALAAAGAGRIGDYSRCAFTSTGTGTFLPGYAANPAIGSPGTVQYVEEIRLEMVFRPELRPAIIAAVRSAHPYEEPAFDVLALVPLATDQGLGRVGELPEPVTLRALTAAVAAALPPAPVGVRAAGDPDRLIRRMAVLGGAGDSHLTHAARAGVDAYLTGDLRHHPAQDHLADGGPALLDGGHWATEWPWLRLAADLLTAGLGGALDCHVSTICTDPWTVAHSVG